MAPSVTVLVLLGLLPAFCSSLNCTLCEYVVESNQNSITYPLNGGNTLCLRAGTRDALQVNNFHGTAASPIVLSNCDGVVTIESTNAGYAINIRNATHFRLTGTGSSELRGIVVKNGQMGLKLERGSKFVEVDHLEISDSGFAGIMAKDDPSCNNLDYNRGNYVMEGVKIHDVFIHNTGGEGMYIGNSFYDSGMAQNCGTVYPHDIINLRVYNNIVSDTDWDGIQIGCAVQDVEVYGNSVIRYGLNAAGAHRNGIQIGGGSSGRWYNNIVRDGLGNGFIILGRGNTTVFNNVIHNTGSSGMFCDNRDGTVEGSDLNILSNTIISPGVHGLSIYSEVTVNRVMNNLIVGVTPPNKFENYLVATATSTNNWYNQSIDTAQFVDLLNNDYGIQLDSPAIDAGTDLSSFGITFDLNGFQRPVGPAFDIGALEYGSVPTTSQGTNPGSESTATTPEDKESIGSRVLGGMAVFLCLLTWWMY